MEETFQNCQRYQIIILHQVEFEDKTQLDHNHRINLCLYLLKIIEQKFNKWSRKARTRLRNKEGLRQPQSSHQRRRTLSKKIKKPKYQKNHHFRANQ